MTPSRAFAIGLILGFGLGGAFEAYRGMGILSNLVAMAVLLLAWGAYPFVPRRRDDRYRIPILDDPRPRRLGGEDGNEPAGRPPEDGE